MSTDTPLPMLGGLSAADFLRDYWQRKPLLIRGAFPDFACPLAPDELAGLACEAGVEARLVEEQGPQGPWQVSHGPFDETTFARLPEQEWTLLVQAVDHYVPEVAELLGSFDFLPRWRLDDIMISYAPPGGSVGPHVDQYDVFLLQGSGQRRWQLGGRVAEDA
ncbi:cupin domain-containing protein, partial [Nocardioides hwasunensis]|uniref:cupin domain-containing protein n=1 Tax=Nocardioides hwasunensis TaxID=397258 RepID=UPI0031D441C4